MTDDKRNHARVAHHFDCRWFGQWGTTEARLNDLSATGCYVVGRLTSPSVGEIVDIEVIPTTKEPLLLSGEVVQVERGTDSASDLSTSRPKLAIKSRAS